MLSLDTGGGVLAIFVLLTLGIFLGVWFITEVVVPIGCYLAPWCDNAL
jgi:hypothetical protein